MREPVRPKRLVPCILGLVAAWAICVAFAPITARADDTPSQEVAGTETPDAGEPSAGDAEDSAEESPALLEGAAEQTDTLTYVQVGMYLLRIPEFSPQEGRFKIDAWLWFRWQGTEVTPHESFEIVNGSIESRELNDVIDDEGYNYAAVRVVATIFHVFDVADFPFDDHVITIELEDSNLEEANLRFVADEGIALDPAVRLEGFSVTLGTPSVAAHTYPTVYGYRSLGTTTSSYSRFKVPLVLRRGDRAPLFKLFWVSYLAVILSLLALRVRATDLDARFGLGTGSIFAASANAFVVNEQLPQTVDLTVAEMVNLLAVGCIFITVFVSVASLRLCYRNQVERSEKLDRFALVFLGLTYVVANVAVVQLGS